MDEYLKNLVKVLAIGASFAALPFFASLAALEPPWPPSIGYVSAALVLVASLIVWEWTRKARVVHRRRWIVVAAALTLVGLLSYLILYSLFVEPIPGRDLRVVRGYECTRQALLLYPDDCPHLGREVLQDAEWEAPVLWTRSSLTMTRVALAAAWLVFMMGLITAIGAIVAGRRLRARPRRSRPAEG
jgi:hypothetical protein